MWGEDTSCPISTSPLWGGRSSGSCFGWGDRPLRFCNDDSKASLEVLCQLAIGNAQNAIALLRQQGVAPLVPTNMVLFAVLAAVQFDDELSLMVGEVQKIAPKRYLTAKMEAVLAQFS